MTHGSGIEPGMLRSLARWGEGGGRQAAEDDDDDEESLLPLYIGVLADDVDGLFWLLMGLGSMVVFFAAEVAAATPGGVATDSREEEPHKDGLDTSFGLLGS